MIITSIACLIAAFFIGGIPFGYIICKKMAGVNIQECGSGNIGSTNVGRIVGKKASKYTQYCDIGKGLLITLTVFILQKATSLPFYEHILPLVAITTILGHDFTPFLHFKGGKGVNTTLGASFMVAWWISPLVVLSALIVYFIVKKTSKYVSLGSMLGGASLPIFYSAFGLIFHKFNIFILIYFLIAGILIVVKHHENIKRLINHEENKAI